MKEEKKLSFLSVIIPTYHDWERLQLCLNALEKQTYPKCKFEIIVVNNDPDDKPPSFLRLPDNCQLLEESKAGSYAARNKALLVAKGEIYAFTDSDCQPKEDWLAIAADFLLNNPEYDRVGGDIKLFSKNKKWNWYEIYELVFAFPQDRFVSEGGMAATGNMIAKKKSFDITGWFNESLMSGGDSDWGKRAQKNKLKIKYLERCIVYHPTRENLEDILTKNRRLMGGHFSNAKEKGRKEIIKLFLKGFMPPINAIKHAVNKKNITFKFKLIAITMSYFLKVSATCELFHLALLKKKVEKL